MNMYMEGDFEVLIHDGKAGVNYLDSHLPDSTMCLLISDKSIELPAATRYRCDMTKNC